jgi:protein-S-isoprenylcysteine O-methyltransferase Ste14
MPDTASPDTPGVAFFPPAGFFGAILAAVALEAVLPLGLLLPPLTQPLAAFGIALAVAAVGLAGWGSRTFKRAGTNVNPHKPALRLVESGPFRFTRNPMYLGMVAFLPGLALAASLDWALLLAPVLWAALHFGVVLREEAYLTAKFGEPYIAYLARTRRWL